MKNFRRNKKLKFLNKKQKMHYEDDEDLSESENDYNQDDEELSSDQDKENESNTDSQQIQNDESSGSSDEDSEQILFSNAKEQDNELNGQKEEDENYNVTKEDKDSFNELISKLRSSVGEVNNKMSTLITNLKSEKAEIKYGVSYLDAKNNMMLIYLLNIVLYSLNKSQGNYDEKVIKNLIYLKTILEKSKVIDLKLKSQIERLIKLSEKSEDDIVNQLEASTKENNKAQKVKEIEEGDYKPNILNDENDETEGEEEEEFNKEEKKVLVNKNKSYSTVISNKDKAQAKYKVNKEFGTFFETNQEKKTNKSRLEKVKNKVANSQLYKDLKSKYSEAPEEYNPYNSNYVRNFKNKNLFIFLF